ncbi:putative deacetylase LmbE-like domain-containing protein [Trametes elegans]|nr:putative deacetylase LmbE-like domain-containing protein [Trametes elegans]
MPEFTRIWLSGVFLAIFWGLLAQPAQQGLGLLAGVPSGQPANVLLLTAHPDDECMFFAPTILALQQQKSVLPPRLHSLCLSVGNADGLGDIRRDELARSLDVLGIDEGRRWVVDRPDLQDNFTAEWDPRTIADVLIPYVLDHNISTILTFDHQGISSHPNHISLPKGAAHLLSTFPSSLPSKSRPRPRLFSLTTVSLAHKYLGPLAPLSRKLALLLSDEPAPVAVSGWTEYAWALAAMQEHRSQLVWFRWLYVSFSRYMWVNEWVEVVPPSGVDSASPAEP